MVLADSRRISRVLRYLGVRSESQRAFVYRTFTFCGRASQPVRLACWFMTLRLYADRIPRHLCTQACSGLGSSLFARRYSGNRFFFLFLEVLRCLTSLRWLRSAYCIQRAMAGHDSRRVSPFGHPRVGACVQLTEAYRSLPRPSSPSRAKASTVRP
jgi:hypothetical protein